MTFIKYIKPALTLFLIFVISSNIYAQKENVKWSKKEGVSENSNSKEIEKTSATGINNSNAKAENILKAGQDGEVEFKIADLTSNFIIGLTPYNRDNKYESIAYSYHISASQVQIIENGIIIMSAGSVSLNDVLKIKREGSNIKYIKNEIIVRTIATNTNYDLVIDVSMITSGSRVKNVKADFKRPLSAFAFVSNITPNDQDNNTGIIDVNPVGGVAPYTYQWSNGITTKYINNLIPGLYTVIIQDANNNEIVQTYIISSLVSAFTPVHFVNENGIIVKHQESLSDSEMMVSENVINTNGWTFAKFKGETISFVFGLDSRKNDFIDSKNIQHGIIAIDNKMFQLKNGRVISRLGEYKSEDKISFIVNNNELQIFKNEIKIASDELENKTYYSKIALTKGKGGLIQWLHSSFWKPIGKTDYYATLTKKLDGSFYEMTNYVNFKYKEKYNDNSLEYTIYDWQRNVKMHNSGISGHSYGINYHSIAAYSSLNDGYYTLEAKNEKDEVYKMRFYFDKVGENGIISVGVIDVNVPIGLDPCCYENPPCLCKIKPIIVNPCNPCEIQIGIIEKNEYFKEINLNWP